MFLSLTAYIVPISPDQVELHHMSLGLDLETMPHRTGFSESVANLDFACTPCVQVLGPMSAHNAERSSKRLSGGPHLGFLGMKVTPLSTFICSNYATAVTTLQVVTYTAADPGYGRGDTQLFTTKCTRASVLHSKTDLSSLWAQRNDQSRGGAYHESQKP